MSEYKIKIWATAGIQKHEEIIDLVEDWGYTEEYAAEVLNAANENDPGLLPSPEEDALAVYAKEMAGYDWGICPVEEEDE